MIRLGLGYAMLVAGLGLSFVRFMYELGAWDLLRDGLREMFKGRDDSQEKIQPRSMTMTLPQDVHIGSMIKVKSNRSILLISDNAGNVYHPVSRFSDRKFFTCNRTDGLLTVIVTWYDEKPRRVKISEWR